ncbi:MAG TPA: hypothetical protein ACFYD6_07485 [Candidatus Brocadiia bacterium]|nr:hypothetical protein [Candidatus Brocadiales bacterium]
MKYFVTIGPPEAEAYEITAKKTEAGGRTFLSVIVDGEQFAIDFWRTPDSPFIPSS